MSEVTHLLLEEGILGLLYLETLFMQPPQHYLQPFRVLLIMDVLK